MDDMPIPAEDQERIDGMVRAYRHSVETLYRLAYIQGAMDEEHSKKKVPA